MSRLPALDFGGPICIHWLARCRNDLGRVTYNSLLAARFFIPPAGETTYFTNNVQSTSRFDGNIVRVGLNYQFH
jgi:hypothetical protein